MSSRCNVIPGFLLLVTCLASTAAAVVPPLPQTPPNYVVDLAGVIDDGVEGRLNGYLRDLERKTTAQAVVLTVLTLEGEPIQDFAVATAHDRWRLGRRDQDNGLLLVVAVQDRKYWIATGYGLEGILPDGLVGSVGREYLVPHFRTGDYSTGIYGATLALVNEVAAASNVELTGVPRMPSSASARPRSRGGGVVRTIFSILFALGLVYLFIRHPRLFIFLMLASMMGGGRRGSWGGGGGGGFGGGGGGGFGGGGAGGGW